MRLKPDKRTGAQIGLQFYAEAGIVLVGGGLAIWAAKAGHGLLASAVFGACFLYFVVSRVLHYLRRIDTAANEPKTPSDT